VLHLLAVARTDELVDFTTEYFLDPFDVLIAIGREKVGNNTLFIGHLESQVNSEKY